MDLQNKMIELAEYNVGFKINNGYFLINITYEDKWSVIPPENPLIEYGEEKGIHYYCAPVNEVSIDEVFDCINQTIEYNMDLQRKVILFHEKLNELQKIFSEEDLETLKTIEFKFKKKKRVKVKQEKNVEEDKIVNEEVSENGYEGVIYEEYKGEEENNISSECTYLEEAER